MNLAVCSCTPDGKSGLSRSPMTHQTTRLTLLVAYGISASAHVRADQEVPCKALWEAPLISGGGVEEKGGATVESRRIDTTIHRDAPE